MAATKVTLVQRFDPFQMSLQGSFSGRRSGATFDENERFPL
jgi:hypothetical protein